MNTRAHRCAHWAVALAALWLSSPAAAQMGGGFDYITNNYVDGTAPYSSLEDTSSFGLIWSTAQPWAPASAVSSTHLSVVWGTSKTAPPFFSPQSLFKVNIWSSLSAHLASPLEGDVFHATKLAPDSGSVTQQFGTTGGTSYWSLLFGFDLDDVLLVSGQTYHFGIHATGDAGGSLIGGIMESSASAPSGVQVWTLGFPTSSWNPTSLIGGSSFDGALLMKFDATILHTPWTDIAGGVAGLSNTTPVLSGVGNLNGNDAFEVNLTNARPDTTASLAVGLSQLSVPFKGGVLVPAPDILVLGVPTGPEGAILLGDTWPAGVPSGASLWFQWWVTDAAGPFGLAASNGLQATTP